MHPSNALSNLPQKLKEVVKSLLRRRNIELRHAAEHHANAESFAADASFFQEAADAFEHYFAQSQPADPPQDARGEHSVLTGVAPIVDTAVESSTVRRPPTRALTINNKRRRNQPPVTARKSS